MRFLLEWLTRHRRIVLFLPWAVTLVALVKLGGYQTFLRPEFRWLLIGGYLILLLLLAAEISREERSLPGAAVLLSPAILLVPLLYLLNARGAELDGYAFQRRLLGTPRMDRRGSPAGRPTSAVAPATGAAAMWAFLDRRPRPPPPIAPTLDSSGTLLLTILDLYRAPEQYDGKLVSIVGMAYRNDDVQKEFGPASFLAFRFRVSCCAADAQPFFVVTRPRRGQPEFRENTWVEARGRFRLLLSRGEKVPVVEDATVSAAPAPEPKYLY